MLMLNVIKTLLARKGVNIGKLVSLERGKCGDKTRIRLELNILE